MITRTDIAAQLEQKVKVNFLSGKKTYTPLRSAFVMEPPSDGAFETYADMGSAPWPVPSDGQPGSGGVDTRTGAQTVGGIGEGAPITIMGGNEKSLIVYNQGFNSVVGITHDAINDNRVGSLDTWAREAGLRFEQHQDFLAFDALNQGAGTTYGNGYDKLPFFSASHIDPNSEYQTAQSNVFTNALTLDTFETAKVAAAKFFDDRGKPMGLSHTLLVVPPDLERRAFQIVGNRDNYSTADLEKNPYAGAVKMLVAPGGWIDSTAWYLLCVNEIRKPINIQKRQAATLVIWDDHTQGNGIRYFKWIARYAPFYGDWRLVIQGNT